MSLCRRRQGEVHYQPESCCCNLYRAVIGRVGLVLLLLGVFVSAGLFTCREASAATTTPHDAAIHFVFLGDIWKYDFATGKATIEVDSQGKSLSEVSWSQNGEALAWTEEWRDSAGDEGRVVYRETASDPQQAATEYVFRGASSPVVSPDGKMCLFEPAGAEGRRLDRTSSIESRGTARLPA